MDYSALNGSAWIIAAVNPRNGRRIYLNASLTIYLASVDARLSPLTRAPRDDPEEEADTSAANTEQRPSHRQEHEIVDTPHG
jgi:hypothetical protein